MSATEARPPSPPLVPLPAPTSARGRRISTQLLCAAALALPMAGISWWVWSTGERVTLETLFLGPLVGGGALIVWILGLHLGVCGDSLAALGFRARGPARDLGLGVLLAALTLAFHVAFGALVRPLRPARPPAPQVVELLSGVSRDPWLLALWLGPVAWIGVALFEELARAFLLRRLWLVNLKSRAWLWSALVLVSALFGLGHVYQGPASVVSIALKSLLLGWVFLRTGRIRALIVAHALYDSAQIVLAVVAIRGMA